MIKDQVHKKWAAHSHDQFFRTVLKNKRVAIDFLKNHVPQEIISQLDFVSLHLQPRSQVNDVNKESIVDVLYLAKLKDGQDVYIYFLLEHQSTPDEFMPFRTLKYVVNTMDDHLKKYKNLKKLPLVYPIVIYHGKRPYPYSTDITALIGAPKELVDRYFLKPFHLVDLSQFEDEALKEHVWSGMMELALKRIFVEDLLRYLPMIAAMGARIIALGDKDYVGIVFQYLFDRGQIDNKHLFFEIIEKQVSSEVGGKMVTIAEQIRQEGRQEGRREMMTIAEQLRQEGRQQGRQEGKQEGHQEGRLEAAKRMLEEGFGLELAAKIAGLSLSVLRAMQQNTEVGS